MEDLIMPADNLSKREKYESLLPQIRALVEGEPDFIANIANIIGALKYGMNFFWVGVYIVKNNELVLGPFQGPVACSRIGFGKGVCGSAWKERKIILVDDVEKFPGHIACNALSKSEIVLPAFKNENVFLVLDVDSEEISCFDKEDEKFLSDVIQIIEKL